MKLKSGLFYLLLGAVSTLGNPPALARSLTEVYGLGQKEYHRAVYHRIYDWFQKNYFDFEKRMSKTEITYVHHCLDHVESFADSRFGGIPLNFLRLGVQGLPSPEYTLAVACPTSADSIQLRKNLLAKRGINLNAETLENVFWIEWSSRDKKINIYSFHDRDKIQLFGQETIWRAMTEQELQKIRMPTYLKNRLDKAILVREGAKDSYLLSLKSLNTDTLSPTFKEIVQKYHQEFGLIPDQVLFQSSGVEWLYLL
jgi:hypothetical protein